MLFLVVLEKYLNRVFWAREIANKVQEWWFGGIWFTGFSGFLIFGVGFQYFVLLIKCQFRAFVILEEIWGFGDDQGLSLVILSDYIRFRGGFLIFCGTDQIHSSWKWNYEEILAFWDGFFMKE
jgi:hypothetical protein